MIAVVVPTLNVAAGLSRTLACLEPARREGLVTQVIVSDGGSRDDTVALAGAAGAQVVTGPAGRGGQLARGAGLASAPFLLFLHADTVLEPAWSGAARAFLADPANAGRVAAFRFALDDEAPAARRLERLVAWRCRTFGLPYGDQGLLLARRFYQGLGGFSDMPLMEDVDLVRRIGRKRITMLPVAAVTSAARYRRDGYLKRGARNLTCLALYAAGLPPRLIVRLYG